MKVNIYNVPKKEFEEGYGKYAYGMSSLEKGQPEIHLKESIKSKKKISGTIEHELGHIFSEKRKITRKLPTEEKKRLLLMAKQNESYTKRGTTSGKGRMQEMIADLYGYSKSNNATKRALKEAFPKTMEIIRDERKKFKPKLVRKKW